MNNPPKHSLNLDILGQTISITCPASETESLKNSAKYLESKLFEMRRTYPALNMDKLVATLALQLSHEVLRLRKEDDTLNLLLTRCVDELDRNIAKATEVVSASSRSLEKVF